MNTPKAIFIDLDGTLLNSKTKQIPASAAAALHLAHQRGILLFVATGRHSAEFERIDDLKQLPLDGFVTLNGAHCYVGDKTIFKNPLDKALVKTVVDYMEHTPFPCIFCEEDQLYISMVNSYVEQEQKRLNVPIPPICDPRRALAPDVDVLQLVAFTTPEIEGFLRGLPNAKITQWTENGFDVGNASTNKWAGVLHMLKHFGIAPEEAAAIGDAENDMEMLANAGFSVAMGNAGYDVKKCAGFVAPHVDDDGFAKAIEHLMNL